MKNNIDKYFGFENYGRYILLYLLALYLIIVSLIFNTPYEIFSGIKEIVFSPDNLITDYMEVGDIGGAFFNSGFMILISTLMIQKTGVEMNGTLIAAVFTVGGFSFFGKNLFNTIPITVGVFLYSKFEKTNFSSYLLPALFGSALGPLVGELAFGFDFPIVKGIIVSYIAGIIVGFVLPPLSQAFLRFHQGFNLYNVGFTAGIVGMFATAVLKMFNKDVAIVNIVSSGNNKELSIVMYLLFGIILLIGFILNSNKIKGYKEILDNTGQLIADFVHLYGFPVTLINMGIMGMIGTSYVLLVGGDLNGPTIGGIFTICGFAAFGKHPKNTIPIFLGVILATSLNIYDSKSTSSLLAALFGTTLAPIAGKYGILAGIIAGFCHTAVVANVGYLHGGMNLYNNGFSGGFIAATLVPIFDSISTAIRRRKVTNEK
ncbi:DUF1576 domain-containing protein [Miniphocaeibacter massiliensis]|uniref:DUF1576 domain-containing protein n=1 Tax=Miniphocaeibacter massiliensis TaxID=2041841 RepID=UPI000C1C166F|nr:DUF1576 domain-containing protein [Miniphocaeibacter massiliensis]